MYDFLDNVGLARLWDKIKALFNPLSARVTTVESSTVVNATSIGDLTARVDMLQYKYHTEITGTEFSVTFANLNDVVVTGVWNQTQARIEF